MRIREEKEDDEEDNGEADIRRAEEEEEKGERRARRGNGVVEAWTDEVMDRVGVASEGCFHTVSYTHLTLPTILRV